MKVHYLVCALLISSILLIPRSTIAQSCGDSSICSDPDLSIKYTCIANLTSQCQALLDTEQQEDKTLQSQLNSIDAKAKLTQLKMDETNVQIAKLDKEIDNLSLRIAHLTDSLNSISKLLINKIIQTYKYGNYSAIDLFFSSNGFADLLEKVKYVSVAQANDKKVLYQLQTTKTAYNDQKANKESRQVQEEKLKKDLIRYQNQLTEQKKAKQQLLNITKNNEQGYRSLIAQLKAEQDSIIKAISNIGPAAGPVTKDKPIAVMGSTGCSTGPHLHFEVFENAKVEGSKIVGTRVNPHNYLDNGKLAPPLLGFPTDTTINAEYGETYQVLGYPSYHWGLDIEPKNGGYLGAPIYAADSGIAYQTSATCECFIKNTCSPEMMQGGSALGNGLIIDHQNGIVTLYWHIL